MYSRNVTNLFLTGRIISVSHVAFGSTRVMATCAHNGQAVGMAAALCVEQGVMPKDVEIARLQRELLRAGQYIPGLVLDDAEDFARNAAVTASSCFELDELPPCGDVQALDVPRAMLLPVTAGPVPAVTFTVDVLAATTLEVQVRSSCRPANYTPEVVLHRQRIELMAGAAQRVRIATEASIDSDRYLAYCLMANPDVAMHLSDTRLTGVLSLSQSMNKAVAKGARQDPPAGSGIDSFEFWLPSRRPGGRNFACNVDPPLLAFSPENVRNGIARPGLTPNAWVAAPDDATPVLSLTWEEAHTIGRVVLTFDTDLDHPLESVLMGHPERTLPFCVKRYRILDGQRRVLYECTGNNQTRNTIHLDQAATTSVLHVEILETHGAPAALFEVRCYAN